MRLLTHNSLKNNSAAAKGKGFPLKVTVAQIRVDEQDGIDDDTKISFIQGILPNLDWPALVAASQAMGIPTLPPALTEDLAENRVFLVALYHVLMNVHLVQGMLTCPVTGREFVVQNEIPNMVLEEEECEAVRF
ncbi:multifunctional methyltransferase subunit TRM112 [Fistulifera solaris]|jgi:multifunctional methyltransferase subunit TRM112|uniref:Multifunctional methyltransferase subunit TRM112 n=1 Tax=Fistulifera solaris TaxID=1519565 RepID=A0A1Z5JXC9_FISSO|nr:multifunctional methyltransferase subunit TRM112 [Fistulifera solaris]|eukprot:GAX18512.1 multifunctional methyltransferase subunit TRM112 [Fistulifera solaris]